MLRPIRKRKQASAVQTLRESAGEGEISTRREVVWAGIYKHAAPLEHGRLVIPASLQDVVSIADIHSETTSDKEVANQIALQLMG